MGRLGSKGEIKESLGGVENGIKGVAYGLLLLLAFIGLVVLGDVEGLVNCLRDGLDVRVHLLLNALHVVSIVVCDQVDGETQVAQRM